MELTNYDINGFTITLPIGLEQTLNTPVRDSYQDFLQKDTSLVRRHLTALTTLLPKYIGKPNLVLHAFGGVGATAQVIDQCVSGVEHVFWERDPTLVNYLREIYKGVELIEDSFARLAHCEYLSQFDAIMFDPSVATIKTPYIKQCWEAMAKANPDVIWLSDTACAKIHLNARFYEKDFGTSVEPTAEGYLQAYRYWLLSNHNLDIVDAMREAAETYCIIKPANQAERTFPIPIPYM